MTPLVIKLKENITTRTGEVQPAVSPAYRHSECFRKALKNIQSLLTPTEESIT